MEHKSFVDSDFKFGGVLMRERDIENAEKHEFGVVQSAQLWQLN